MHKDPPKDKHPGGRPPLYKSAEEMQKLIDEYFLECEGKPFIKPDGEVLTDKHGYPVMVGVKPPSIVGLALKLGLKSRQAIINYQDRPEFNDTITRAKMRIEEYNNARLFDKDGVRGAMFSLSVNYGYVEKQGIEHSGQIGVKIVDDIE